MPVERTDLGYWLRFGGRIGRTEFWINHLILVAFLVVANIVSFVLQRLVAGIPVLSILLALPFVALFLLGGWAGLMLTFKRLHDLDRSAWFYLIILIPIIGALILLVSTGFIRGTTGPNRFGADPLNSY